MYRNCKQNMGSSCWTSLFRKKSNIHVGLILQFSFVELNGFRRTDNGRSVERNSTMCLDGSSRRLISSDAVYG